MDPADLPNGMARRRERSERPLEPVLGCFFLPVGYLQKDGVQK
jgi:hypothetical protein